MPHVVVPVFLRLPQTLIAKTSSVISAAALPRNSHIAHAMFENV